MAAPYSEDLRERAVALVDGGMSRRQVAKLLELGASTVIKWMKLRRETGGVAAKAMGGDRRSRLTAQREFLLKRAVEEPDMTLEELRAELKERGLVVGYGTVQRFFASEDFSFKKNRARRRAGAP
jgi:putative transposase